MRRSLAAMLLGLAVLALGISVYLTYAHIRIHGEPGWQSACAINDVVSCDAALTSRFGSIAGTPLAALGAWFYGFSALIAGAALGQSRFPRSHAVVLLLTNAFASVLSVTLLGASWAIRSICPLCAVLHLINFGSLALSWKAFRDTHSSFRQTLSDERIWWNTRADQAARWGAIAVLALVAVFWAFLRHPATPSRLCDASRSAASRPAGSAPSPLVVYLDFQCPHCQKLDAFLRTIRDNPRIEIIPRRHPQERECNASMTQPGRPGSCLLARAAICAERLGHYDEFSDRLFDGGARQRKELVSLAGALRIDPDEFNRCIDDDDTQNKLQAELRAAASDGVYKLPTILFEGVQHVGGLDDEDQRCLSDIKRQ